MSSKAPRRPKNVSGASQSSAARELASDAYTDPQRLESLNKLMRGVQVVAPPTVSATDTEEADSSLALQLQLALKSSVATKQKALAGIIEKLPLCSTMAVVQYTVNVIELIKIHVFHEEVSIRALSFTMLAELMKRKEKDVKNELGRLVEPLMGPWVCGMNDVDVNARNAAMKGFEMAFTSTEKQQAAISKTYKAVNAYVDEQFSGLQLAKPLSEDPRDSRQVIAVGLIGTLRYLLQVVPDICATVISETMMNKTPLRCLLLGEKSLTAKVPLVRAASLEFLSQTLSAFPPPLTTPTFHTFVLACLSLSITDQNAAVCFAVSKLLLTWCQKHEQACLHNLTVESVDSFLSMISDAENPEVLEVALHSVFPLFTVLSRSPKFGLESLDNACGVLVEKVKELAEKSHVRNEQIQSWTALCECWELHCLRKQGACEGDSVELFSVMMYLLVKLWKSSSVRLSTAPVVVAKHAFRAIQRRPSLLLEIQKLFLLSHERFTIIDLSGPNYSEELELLLELRSLISSNLYSIALTRESQQQPVTPLTPLVATAAPSALLPLAAYLSLCRSIMESRENPVKAWTLIISTVDPRGVPSLMHDEIFESVRKFLASPNPTTSVECSLQKTFSAILKIFDCKDQLTPNQCQSLENCILECSTFSWFDKIVTNNLKDIPAAVRAKIILTLASSARPSGLTTVLSLVRSFDETEHTVQNSSNFVNALLDAACAACQRMEKRLKDSQDVSQLTSRSTTSSVAADPEEDQQLTVRAPEGDEDSMTSSDEADESNSGQRGQEQENYAARCAEELALWCTILSCPSSREKDSHCGVEVQRVIAAMYSIILRLAPKYQLVQAASIAHLRSGVRNGEIIKSPFLSQIEQKQQYLSTEKFLRLGDAFENLCACRCFPEHGSQDLCRSMFLAAFCPTPLAEDCTVIVVPSVESLLLFPSSSTLIPLDLLVRAWTVCLEHITPVIPETNELKGIPRSGRFLPCQIPQTQRAYESTIRVALILQYVCTIVQPPSTVCSPSERLIIFDNLNEETKVRLCAMLLQSWSVSAAFNDQLRGSCNELLLKLLSSLRPPTVSLLVREICGAPAVRYSLITLGGCVSSVGLHSSDSIAIGYPHLIDGILKYFISLLNSSSALSPFVCLLGVHCFRLIHDDPIEPAGTLPQAEVDALLCNIDTILQSSNVAVSSIERLILLIVLLRHGGKIIFPDALGTACINFARKQLQSTSIRTPPPLILQLLAELCNTRLLNAVIYTDLSQMIATTISKCYSLSHLPTNGRLGQRVPGAQEIPPQILRDLSQSIVLVHGGIEAHRRRDEVTRSTIHLVLFDIVCEAIARLKTLSEENAPHLVDLVSSITPFISVLPSTDLDHLSSSEACVSVVSNALLYLHSWVCMTPVAKMETIGKETVGRMIGAVMALSLPLVGASVLPMDSIQTVRKRCIINPYRGEFVSNAPRKFNTFVAAHRSLSKTVKQRYSLFTYLLSWCILLTAGNPPMSTLPPLAELRLEIFQLLDLIASLLLAPIGSSKKIDASVLCSTAEMMETEPLGFDPHCFVHWTSVLFGSDGSEATTPPEHELRRVIMGALAKGSATLLCFLLQRQTRSLVRDWLDTVDRRLASMMRTFVERHISPVLIQSSFAEILSQSPDGTTKFEIDEGFTVHVQQDQLLVNLIFQKDELQLRSRILLPKSYPLENAFTPPDILKEPPGIPAEKWRGWMKNLAKSISSSNFTLWDAVRHFGENLVKAFEGVEPCPICYCVVQATNKKLPEMRCPVCKHSAKFHSACLSKWWATSEGGATCPLCRSPWLS